MDIRLSKTNSVNSVNRESVINVDINHSSRPMPFDSVTDKVDSYEVYLNERGDCEKYRLILTVKPYCTNVLFNPCTEVIKNEGSNLTSGNDAIEVVTDNDDFASCPNAYGKKTNIMRRDMVYNTEYSRETIGYEYHPGYDIFDNHIIRNKTFKTINYIRPNSSNVDKFNTLEDFSRKNNGDVIRFTPRTFDTTTSTFTTAEKDKHVYLVEDVMSFESLESVTNNLRIENGWVGVKNTNTIDSVDNNNQTPMDINRLINSKGDCEFVDMYPDRTLYSFIPKYNRYKRQPEYNWDIILTYPFKNFYNHNLVQNVKYFDGDTIVDNEQENIVNALLMMSCKKLVGPSGNDVALFRSYVKHGLNENDNIRIYYSTDQGHTYKVLDTDYWVTHLGDIRSENKDNFFYITDNSFFDSLFGDEILDKFYRRVFFLPEEIYGAAPTSIPRDDDPCIMVYGYVEELEPIAPTVEYVIMDAVPTVTDENSPFNIAVEIDGVWHYYHKETKYYCVGKTIDGIYYSPSELLQVYLSEMEFRVARVYNECKSEYYIRLFRKIPNLKYRKQELTDAIAINDNELETYINANARDGEGKMILFNSESSSMAFANTIYNDSIAQYVYTDSIETSHLVDNQGRPLSSFYVSILKRNKGFKEWYGVENIEKDITSDNIEYSHCFGKINSGFEFLSLKGDGTSEHNKRKFLSDVGMLRKPFENIDTQITQPRSVEDWIGIDDITIDDDMFVGDICEWNDYEAMEHVINDASYRFNTVMREYGSELMEDYNFTVHELISDDYDRDGFQVTVSDCYTLGDMLTRPEGYYYKPHYEIPIRVFGANVLQASHRTLYVKKAEPVQAEGMFIKLTLYNNSKVDLNDTVFICNDIDSVWYSQKVVYIEKPNVIILSIIPRDIEVTEGKPYVDWITVCNKLNDKSWSVRSKNSEIPSYAKNVGTNTFLWRNVIKNDDNILNYPFTNNHLYVEKDINFYLRRQDPFRMNGLYYFGSANAMFPDIDGGRPMNEMPFFDNYIYNADNPIC